MSLPRLPITLVALLAASLALAQTAPPSISVREAHDGARTGRMVLVDVRPREEQADTGVAEGAIRLDMTSPAFEAKLAGIRLDNPGTPLALIGRIGAAPLLTRLAARGWRDLVDVRGGMLGAPGQPGWLAERLPVVAP